MRTVIEIHKDGTVFAACYDKEHFKRIVDDEWAGFQILTKEDLDNDCDLINYDLPLLIILDGIPTIPKEIMQKMRIV